MKRKIWKNFVLIKFFRSPYIYIYKYIEFEIQPNKVMVSNITTHILETYLFHDRHVLVECLFSIVCNQRRD